MAKAPQIADAEWAVMKELWKQSPRTAGGVAQALGESKGWKLSTVKTLLNRLVAKKAVGFAVQGKAYLYRPLVDEAACTRAESRSFLQRVFDGSLAPMVARFIEQDGLTPEQVKELKDLLERAEKERGR